MLRKIATQVVGDFAYKQYILICFVLKETFKVLRWTLKLSVCQFKRHNTPKYCHYDNKTVMILWFRIKIQIE